MFIIGLIIFILYCIGLFYAISWGHKSQEKDDYPNVKEYYNRHNNFNKEL